MPDQRDTYPGQQVTIFDNRGICQHSGLCTDRLATAFRTSQEPFVAPERRPDGRAHPGRPRLPVRGAEPGLRRHRGPGPGRLARPPRAGHRGHPGRPVPGDRRPAADRRRRAPTCPGPRAPPASTTRSAAAVTRRTSRSAAACTGTSGSATRAPARRRADPVRVGRRPARADPDDPPAVREARARRRPARAAVRRHAARTTRSARRPSWPGRSAGPARRAAVAPAGDAAAAGGRVSTRTQRARWVALALRAADEAKLPADPEFRAALTSYLEWRSRQRGRQRLARRPPGTGARRARPPPAPADAPPRQEPAVTLPGPDETVSFEAHIKPLFREHDRKSMTFAFDLWSCDDVRAHAAEHPGPAPRRHHALRRRLAARADRGVPALDRNRAASRKPGADACSPGCTCAPAAGGAPPGPAGRVRARARPEPYSA